MNYLVEIKDGPESKPLFDYLRTLKYVKVIYESKGTYHFTNEEMALPMRKKPSKGELNEFLDREQGKGAGVKTVRKRAPANLAKKRKK